MTEVETKPVPATETPVSSAEVPDEKSGSKLWLYIGGAVAVVVIVGLLVWLLF